MEWILTRRESGELENTACINSFVRRTELKTASLRLNFLIPERRRSRLPLAEARASVCLESSNALWFYATGTGYNLVAHVRADAGRSIGIFPVLPNLVIYSVYCLDDKH
jgi:hypothetical protein